MSYDSRGNFNRIHCWENDRLNDVEIASDRHDEEDDNFAQGLSQCLLRDGRAAMTGNLNINNYRVQNVANGTAATDAVNKSQLDGAIGTASSTLTTAYENYVETVLSTIYPVGSVYIGTQLSCPMASLITGSTWTLVSSGKALWTGTGSNGNTTIAAGLPNITGATGATGKGTPGYNVSGAFYTDGSSNACSDSTISACLKFDASRSNSIYGKSNTVQPPAYVVNVWRRTA